MSETRHIDENPHRSSERKSKNVGVKFRLGHVIWPMSGLFASRGGTGVMKGGHRLSTVRECGKCSRVAIGKETDRCSNHSQTEDPFVAV